MTDGTRLKAGTTVVMLPDRVDSATSGAVERQMIDALQPGAGVIIDGNADKVVDMIDVWTFARDTSSRDPNWLLVATEAGA